MNREEILEKSRNERRDEGEIQAENKGMYIGNIVFTFAFLALLILNYLCNQKSWGYVALASTFEIGESYAKYKFSKNRWDMLAVVGSILACIGAFTVYIVDVLEQMGWVN